MDDQHQLEARLRALEEENARLRAAAHNKTGTELTVTEGEYKGYPTLTFEGSFRGFTLGLSKLRVIEKAWPQIRDFLAKHSQKTGRAAHSDVDDRI